MANPKDLPRDIGGFIRDLRRSAKISLRQLAKQAGVSNPYLSQVERGLRKPSAEVLQQVELTFDSFEQMCGWENNLDLRLSREQLAELRGSAI